jgi:hypothetical protein
MVLKREHTFDTSSWTQPNFSVKLNALVEVEWKSGKKKTFYLKILVHI